MGIKREGRTPKGTWGVRNSCLCALIIFLAACSGSSKQDYAESEGLVLTGSVGDGPIVGADIRIEDASGDVVFEGISDETANYQLAVPDGTRLPVTVRVSGGTDLVTGRGADFEMLSVAFESGPITLNVSPFTTLAVATARCLGEISPRNITAAWDLIDATVSLGWHRDKIADLMGEAVDEANITTVLVGSEALGELVRRTAAASTAGGELLSTDEVLTRLACDITDGRLDGVGPDVDARTGLMLAANATAVGLEVIAGSLKVDGTDAMDRLDYALQTVLPGAAASVMELAPSQALIDQTRDQLGVFTTPDNPPLLSLALALEDATPATARADIEQALSDSASSEIGGLSEEIAAAPRSTLDALSERQQQPAEPPLLSFAADPPSVLSGSTTRLSWAATNAEGCVARGGWNGIQPTSGTEQSTALIANTEFVLSCSGRGGVVTERLLVNVSQPVPDPSPDPQPDPEPSPNPGPSPEPDPSPEPEPIPEPAPDPAPVVGLQADRSSVDAGDTAVLSWNAAHATSCTASGAWGGSRSTSGSQTVGPLSADVNFVLTCTGPGGSHSASVSVAVSAPSPALSLNASSVSVEEGSSVILSWSSANTDSCTASGAWSGSRATSGSMSTGPLSASATFALQCSGEGGTVSDSVAVTVTAAPADPPSLNFSSSDDLIDQGAGVTLSWTSTGATGCTASGGWSGARATSGSEFIGNIGSSTTFSLTCSGPGGNEVRMLTVSTLSSVALNWVAPAENVDGTPLTDLAGYRIYYGTSSRNYSGMVELNDPFDTSHTLSLASGDYYVAMTALDLQGNESAYSNEVLKTAP